MYVDMFSLDFLWSFYYQFVCYIILHAFILYWALPFCSSGFLKCWWFFCNSFFFFLLFICFQYRLQSIAVEHFVRLDSEKSVCWWFWWIFSLYLLLHFFFFCMGDVMVHLLSRPKGLSQITSFNWEQSIFFTFFSGNDSWQVFIDSNPLMAAECA